MKKLALMTLTLLMAVAMQAETVSITASAWASAQSLSDGDAVTSYSQNGVTVAFAQNTGASTATYNAQYSAVAAVSGNTMTVSVPAGTVLTQAVFTMANSPMATNLNNATWSAGEKSVSGSAVTWIGSVESLTVTMGNMVGFASFSLTYTAGTVLNNNDTTTLNVSNFISQWNNDNPWEPWPSGDVDSLRFEVGNKVVSVKKGTGEDAGQVSCSTSEFKVAEYSTLTISAPYIIHRIEFTFERSLYGTRWIRSASCSAGELSETENCWTGCASEVTITSGGNYCNIRKLVIICDSTVNSGTIVFLGLDGQPIGEPQVVPFGGTAVPPVLPLNPCQELVRWEGGDYTHVMGDMTLTPIVQKEVVLSLTADAWNAQTGTEEGLLQPITVNGYQIAVTPVGGAYIGLRRPTTIEGETYSGRAAIYENRALYIKAAAPFNNMTFICQDAETSTKLATASWNTGEAVADSLKVYWQGYTDSLAVLNTDEINSLFFLALRIECQYVSQYTVVFFDVDGKEIKREVVARGNSATAPANMEETGYTFNGWDTNFTNLTGDVPLLYVHPLYTELEGYVTVRFETLDGQLIETRRVLQGGSISDAPTDVPAMQYHIFAGWSEPLTNITTDMTVQPVYELHLLPSDILSVEQWKAMLESWEEDEKEREEHFGEVYVIRGVLDELYNINAEGKATVKLKGQNYSEAYGYELLGPNQEPFYSRLQFFGDDTLTIYGEVGNERFGGSGGMLGDEHICLKNGYVVEINSPVSDENVVLIRMPDAATLYDESGDGLKQTILIARDGVIDAGGYGDGVNISATWTYSFTKKFRPYTTPIYHQYIPKTEEVNLKLGQGPMAVEYVTKDGKLDFSTYTSGYEISGGAVQGWFSGANGYTKADSAMVITNFDVNGDGRMDYMYPQSYGVSQYDEIAYQLPGGGFRREMMEMLTPAASAPRRAQGINKQVSAPMRAVDLNGDAIKDLVNERDGIIYYGRADGRWEKEELDGSLTIVDLNGDGVLDIIVHGDALVVKLFNPSSGSYTTQSLLTNVAVDDEVYPYDFDGDGDIDILASSSYYTTATKVAYNYLFTNNGQGNFVAQPAQNYGTNKLWFSACQDINGDGHYDLLAFRGDIYIGKVSKFSDGTYAEYTSNPEIVWMRGNANYTFDAPQKLYDLPLYNEAVLLWNSPNDAYQHNAMMLHLQVEDLDNDGKMELWCSGLKSRWDESGRAFTTTEIYPMSTATANVRPSAPAAPTLQYNDGILTVTWGDGADDHTSACDLSYAVRIGTTSGGNDILAAHANVDGTRRNFLDGNAGRAHSYRIDLSTYAPGTVYVSVQAIDAQHAGSQWSQEASIAHTKVSAAFTIINNKIAYNELAEIQFAPLPEGYAHTWLYDSAQVVEQGEAFFKLQYATPGEKTITHIVTPLSGKADTLSLTLTVLPAGLGEPTIVDASSLSATTHIILQLPMADYTLDGRMDGVLCVSKTGATTIQEGDSANFFHPASGTWNAHIMGENETLYKSLWMDYDRDGKVDFLFDSYQHFSMMLHHATLPELTERQDNDTLEIQVGYTKHYNLRQDFRHYGLPDGLYREGENHWLVDVGEDKNIYYKPFVIDGNAELFHTIIDQESKTLIADFDHDGYMDIAGMEWGGMTTCSALNVFYNRGNGHFAQQDIPFASAVTTAMGSMFTPRLVDLNGDGYQDIVLSYYNSDITTYGFYVLWNNANQSFSAAQTLPNSNVLYGIEVLVTDLDNNGYPDIVAAIHNTAISSYTEGTYVWYMGAEGMIEHAFLIPDAGTYELRDYYPTPADHRLVIFDAIYPVVAQADARPAAPTGIATEMTEEGMWITWNAAVDDHTPAALMRYNLSMKRQSSDTYLFSPQNGGNAEAAYLPDYTYINATRFFVPKADLYQGSYEIALQAVDMQNKMSLFSPTLTVAVNRNPIEAPSFYCGGEDLVVSYRGTETTGTPTWTFDGAIVRSGSGFGPYTLYWMTSGPKEITLTLNGTIYRDTVTIDNLMDEPVTIPNVLYEETPASASVPEGLTYKWYASINGGERLPIEPGGIRQPSETVGTHGSILVYDERLKAEGLNLMAHRDNTGGTLVGETVRVFLEVTNANGCVWNFNVYVTVMASTNVPTLTLVTTNADGHNVVNWTNADAFATINIYKEGNTLNDFQLLANANAVDGAYIDANSDATQKAERYQLKGVMANGNESPASAIHKTVHLTINRGVMDGTYNLIWNEYAGASVVSYNILRGTTSTSLEQIATVASSNTSYTDQAPVDNKPYYAIEYVLPAAAAAPANDANHAPAANLSGRSNVVNRNTLGIEDVQAEGVAPQKFLIDGTIYILRGDRTYTLTGQEVK